MLVYLSCNGATLDGKQQCVSSATPLLEPLSVRAPRRWRIVQTHASDARERARRKFSVLEAAPADVRRNKLGL